MEYFRIDPYHPQLKGIEKAVDVLKAGGVIVFPTDTLYGLGVDAYNENALHKLFLLKQRSPKHPVSVMVDSIDQIEEISGMLPIERYDLLKRMLPGKFTILLPAAQSEVRLPDILVGPRGKRKKIGFRIPDHAVCRSLSKAFGRPITATSANISGQKNALSIKEVIAQLGSKPAFILDAGPISESLGSTVLDFTGEHITLQREGEVSLNHLKMLFPGTAFARKKSKYKILFICSGNINRSPLAKVILQAAIQKTRYRAIVDVDSAGTLRLLAQPAHHFALQVAQENKLDLSRHRSKPVTKNLLEETELVICMASDHQNYLRKHFPEEKEKIVLLKQWRREARLSNPSVADPMGHNLPVYHQAFREISTEIKRILPFIIGDIKDYLKRNEIELK